MQRTRNQRPRIRSAYSRHEPPPYNPPDGVAEVTAWELAAVRWREHLPDEQLGSTCVTCESSWPCDAWDIANDIINDCRDLADNEATAPAL